MDLLKILGELHAERQRIEKIIETLELVGSPKMETKPKKRGRKYMDAAARKAVSLRMKRYWAARRGEVSEESGTAPDGNSE